jgi:HK97 family phage portal protein
VSLLSSAIAPRVKATRVTVSEDGTYAVGPTLDSIATHLPSSWAGMTPETALNMITVYQIVRVLSNTFAQLPLILYRRLANGGKERATDNPLYRTLHLQPNPDMTSFAWRRLMMVHLLTWGNHYAEKARDAMGRPLLYPIRPDRIEVSREDNVKVFDYFPPDGQAKRRLPPGRIFHVQALSSDGLVGRSPISDLRRSIRLGRTAEDFGDSFFRNNARPGIVLKHPSLLDDNAIGRLTAQMDSLRGSGNSGRTVILEEGLDFAEIGIPPDDAQFMETRLFQKRELAGAFGVSPHKIGDLERATFSNIEHLALEHITDTMMPWFVNVEQECSVQLIDDDEQFVEFLADGYLRGDAETRNKAYQIRWQHGALTPNEWRIKENDNPYDGGDVFYTPVNYAPVTVPGEEPAAEEQEEAPPDEGPPFLVAVKATEVRCSSCKRLLAESATPPYRMTCPRCKGVEEVA